MSSRFSRVYTSGRTGVAGHHADRPAATPRHTGRNHQEPQPTHQRPAPEPPHAAAPRTDSRGEPGHAKATPARRAPGPAAHRLRRPSCSPLAGPYGAGCLRRHGRQTRRSDSNDLVADHISFPHLEQGTSGLRAISITFGRNSSRREKSKTARVSGRSRSQKTGSDLRFCPGGSVLRDCLAFQMEQCWSWSSFLCGWSVDAESGWSVDGEPFGDEVATRAAAATRHEPPHSAGLGAGLAVRADDRGRPWPTVAEPRSSDCAHRGPLYRPRSPATVVEAAHCGWLSATVKSRERRGPSRSVSRPSSVSRVRASATRSLFIPALARMVRSEAWIWPTPSSATTR